MKKIKIFLILAVLSAGATAATVAFLWHATSMVVEPAALNPPISSKTFHTYGLSLDLPKSFEIQYLEADFTVPGHFEVNLVENSSDLSDMIWLVNENHYDGLGGPESFKPLSLSFGQAQYRGEIVDRDGHSIFCQVLLLEDLDAGAVQAFQNEVSLTELPKASPEAVMKQRKSDLMASVEYFRSCYTAESDEGQPEAGGLAARPRSMFGRMIPGDLSFSMNQLLLADEADGYSLSIVWDGDKDLLSFFETSSKSQGLQLLSLKFMQMGMLAVNAVEGIYSRSGLYTYDAGGRPQSAIMIKEGGLFEEGYSDFYIVGLVPDKVSPRVVISIFRNNQLVNDFEKESSETLAYWDMIGPTFRTNNLGYSILSGY